ncbi:DUF3540 domain-containing protein [Chitiniphilus purpureus]|uniref:DUF3540 domain-containing protein n=1 Tax=Chitiniphilus purpureus TaxID=2981137 RepID=A0ABY6DSB6_9NEIS|nr:DUF3540 domain-containing protein [Chitiniphilus sp. CD1]UXY17247.1 DUF3540 domain-containing protein [Chitiniphilus sp. CD1]
MMRLEDTPAAQTVATPQWSDARIAVALDDGRFLLHDGRIAQQAPSCLVQPQAGDRALVVGCADGDSFIVHLLARTHDEAVLSVHGASALSLSQARIALNASDSVKVRALGELHLNAATGGMHLNSRNLFIGVTETLIEQTRHRIARAEHYLLTVRDLLRLHGKQTLLTAEKDVKVDADRISVG